MWIVLNVLKAVANWMSFISTCLVSRDFLWCCRCNCTLKLLQQLSIRLQWQRHQQEMHGHSLQLQTCLQHVLSRRSRADESQSVSWHSRRRSQRHRRHNSQLHWCQEQDGSQQPPVPFPHSLRYNPLYSRILMHRWVWHHIHRVKTHFYEMWHKFIDTWMRCWLWEQILPVYLIIMRHTALHAILVACVQTFFVMSDNLCRCLSAETIAAHSWISAVSQQVSEFGYRPAAAAASQ